MTAAMPAIATGDTWPALARRRGAIAAATLLVLAVDAQMDPRIQELLLSAVPWRPWVFPVWAVGYLCSAFLVLPLLGPGAMHSACGGRPSVGSMRNGLVLGLAGVALFYAQSLSGFFAPFQSSGIAGVEALLIVQNLFIILLGPLTEEFVYRGVLWSAVRRVSPAWISISITALVFTIGHGPSRTHDFPCLFAYGVLLGILRHRSRGLSPTMLAHSVTNVGLTLFVSV